MSSNSNNPLASLIAELRELLPNSDSKLRKHWANEILQNEFPLMSFASLLHGETKVAQRFTWVVGDIAEMEPRHLLPCMPLFFSQRDSMPFSGMQRSVAKWLWLTNRVEPMTDEAVEVLLDWMSNDSSCIASKSFAAKALMDLCQQGRVERDQLAAIFDSQSNSYGTKAYQHRIKKLRQQL